jgi:Kef-type K+ transport system membrane component KefB
MTMDVFLEISVIIMIATIIGGILKFLKQPLIIGHILTGIIISPYFLNLIDSNETLGIFSHIGIAFLLFIVGLGLNIKMFHEVGRASIVTGVGQVIFTSIIGYILSILMGFTHIISMYVAIALTFSSTIIIMKLLTDKGDTDKTYGKISIGFLIVQDLIVIFVLLFISSISTGESIQTLIYSTILSLVGLLAVIFLFTKYILSNIIHHIAKCEEYMLLFSIGWCFALSTLFYYFDFSIEIGALIAGICLASSPYKTHIESKITPLRDFFLILFFVLLGSQMVFEDISRYILPIIVFSIFILIGNPLIVITLMKHLGYSHRTGFMCGLTVAQISEFSLILITLGITVGHIPQEILSMITVIGLITIAGSSYMIMYSEKIFLYLSKYKIFREFERK